MANIIKNRPLVQVSFLVLSSLSLLMAGCSGDSDDAKGVEQVSANNTMDVKQPVASSAPKASLQTELPVTTMSDTAEAKVVEVVETVKESAKEAVKEVEQAVDKVAAKTVVKARTGKEIFAICAGCHGSLGEGGVGPRLHDQKQADLIAKLTRYKNGEQVGPMSAMMRPMAKALSHAEVIAVVEYVVTLK